MQFVHDMLVGLQQLVDTGSVNGGSLLKWSTRQDERVLVPLLFCG